MSEIQTGVTVVKLKRTLVTIITVFTLFAQSVTAQSVIKTDDSLKNAEVSIRFYNRTLYYPGNASDNPVYVHVSIRNTGSSTLRFKLADDRMFSIDFKAFNLKNASLAQTDNLIKKRTTSQTVYFREIALEPEEEYSFVENVKDYIDITDPSIYYLVVSFYPELYRNKDTVITSRRLTLEVRPTPSAAASTYLPVESNSVAILQAEEISPDKVIEQTIIARQQSSWDQYFLYMDLEAMLKNNPSRARSYNTSSADHRAEMLRQFRSDLMQSRIDFDIVAVPSKFEIEETRYSQTEGTVKVIEWFKNNTFMEKKRYTYYVRQRDGIWQIYDYVVDNLPSEPLN